MILPGMFYKTLFLNIQTTLRVLIKEYPDLLWHNLKGIVKQTIIFLKKKIQRNNGASWPLVSQKPADHAPPLWPFSFSLWCSSLPSHQDLASWHWKSNLKICAWLIKSEPWTQSVSFEVLNIVLLYLTSLEWWLVSQTQGTLWAGVCVLRPDWQEELWNKSLCPQLTPCSLLLELTHCMVGQSCFLCGLLTSGWE